MFPKEFIAWFLLIDNHYKKDLLWNTTFYIILTATFCKPEPYSQSSLIKQAL